MPRPAHASVHVENPPLASGADHIDHVSTQLPYALLAGSISALGFVILGLFWLWRHWSSIDQLVK